MPPPLAHVDAFEAMPVPPRLLPDPMPTNALAPVEERQARRPNLRPPMTPPAPVDEDAEEVDERAKAADAAVAEVSAEDLAPRKGLKRTEATNHTTPSSSAQFLLILTSNDTSSKDRFT